MRNLDMIPVTSTAWQARGLKHLRFAPKERRRGFDPARQIQLCSKPSYCPLHNMLHCVVPFSPSGQGHMATRSVMASSQQTHRASGLGATFCVESGDCDRRCVRLAAFDGASHIGELPGVVVHGAMNANDFHRHAFMHLVTTCRKHARQNICLTDRSTNELVTKSLSVCYYQALYGRCWVVVRGILFLDFHL